MPLHESEAIILQSYPLGEADRLVSFLSRSMGRVRGVAAGARRPKSRFGSTLERMSYVRIWFYERETRELVRINQCELIESFLDVFKDYAAGVVLTLFAEITEAVLPDREASDPSFRLLLLSAQKIKESREVDLPLAYFAVWTVRLGGWLGSLESCARCGKKMAGDAAYASPLVPGIFCADCRGLGMKPLSGTALGAGRKILGDRLDKIGAAGLTKPALRELSRYALDLIEHQIERKLISREMLETAL
ncbi:MAG TPA: DNA repair protein RecO [Candidatus Limnocylindrales bacterium]|nr:DNA repair protein RecO [Candidatus Limnocylindrales bacterium]